MPYFIANFEEYLTSPQFTFLVGEAKEPIVVYSKALATISQPLDRLINGHMKEAEERCAEIPDIEKGDFVRLCEYAYRGDYTVPLVRGYETWYKFYESKIDGKSEKADAHKESPSKDGSQSRESNGAFSQDLQTTTEQKVVDVENMTRYAVRQAAQDRDKLRKERNKAEEGLNLPDRFNGRMYLLGRQPRDKISNGFAGMPKLNTRLSFAPVLLAHARLYCIADRYLIEHLKDLALHKLHSVLKAFSFHMRKEGRTKDIVTLARFAYSNDNTMDRDESGNLDDLRRMVIDFVVLHIRDLQHSKAFEELLHEGGEFVVDFWRLERKEGMVRNEGPSEIALAEMTTEELGRRFNEQVQV